MIRLADDEVVIQVVDYPWYVVVVGEDPLWYCSILIEQVRGRPEAEG